MINVAIVEDNDTIREGLSALINGTDGYRCVAVFRDCESFLSKLNSLQVDVVLMDIGLPGISGIEGVQKALSKNPELNILMLTIYEESDKVFDALCAGATGYLVKKTPPAKLLEAIKDAYEGGSPMSSGIARQVINAFKETKIKDAADENYNLSSREIEVLNLLADGFNYQEIAENLFISVDTVRHHIRNIYKKLHVHSQSEAVAKAIRKRII
ncbi:MULTISPECIES: response regulator transcription factor [Ignavibacterium]|uniref:response regulator transcription factor n=1 Tax=Ignavibacterium TaxID=795750 RepID=UPI0025C2DD6D|nr:MULTISPECIES: response regulator transcription factor [Ignavibacterium]MBI5662514.1 response regulator transcription factor [Ignavibacterium album]